MTLKLNGYATAQFGKCHEVPVWQTSPAGPFNAWPTGGGGFEYFYGFIGGENNQWDPALYEGTTPIEPPKTPAEGYHLTEDLTDKAINWVRQQKALLPDKPFFMYFAPGATHAPHHVPQEWIEKYKGKFAHGWDAPARDHLRPAEGTGVIAADADLTATPCGDPGLGRHGPDELQAGAGARDGGLRRRSWSTPTTTSGGCSTRSRTGVSRTRSMYHIIGDNGASAEGTLQRRFNETANFNGMAAIETPEFLPSKIDEFGAGKSYGHYAVGWAWAMDPPFQWTKQVASHWGGTRNGTIVHWPNGIAGEGRHAQRSSVTSSTSHRPMLEAAGIPAAHDGQRRAQSPIEGTSMLYTFNAAGRAGAAQPAVLRDVLQQRHLPQGLERGHQAPHAVGDGRSGDARLRR